ncbi:glycosyltransferase, family 2 [Aliarcobacter butzleri 7h1h]|uniref:glycosyltransferase family 2 protein n=1 Tax=Aliarcobacter butzleri TaxID=28197 RepID=UPI00035B993D|nr:glycosyltransferase family 2 protein [Aliarcobacter butzleri]AGR78442.1 glycosyltransferase, family 2 [Aliarcobacter butzleri 7h1h]
MNKLVSIIIPVYNTEEYLDKCLNSCINQTFKDIEIIIINDGSTDNSFEICKEYLKIDSRIRLFNQENRGQGFARNFGIMKSKSDFIYFLDSDDFIEPDTIEQLYNQVIFDKSDIVIGGWEKVNEDLNQIIKTNPAIDVDVLNSKNKVSYIFSFQFTYVACGILINKKIFLDNFLFFPNYFHEDLYLMPKIFYFARKISYVDNKFYKWIERNDSSSNSFSMEHAISVGGILVDWSNFLLKEKIYKENQKSLFKGFIKCIAFGKNQTKKFASINQKDEILAYFHNLENNFDINFSKYNQQQQNNISNLNFSHSLNNIYKQIDNIKQSKKEIAIYGNGLFGKFIAKELNEQIIVILDKNMDIQDNSQRLNNPSKINNYTFDKILICVLGREDEIIDYLKNELNIREDKIITFRI